MTGGRVVVLGRTGRNFAAGMSGGLAYLLDLDEQRLNTEMVVLDPLDEDDRAFLRETVGKHFEETRSAVAERLLADWDSAVERFSKVMPMDYKRVLGAMAAAREAGTSVDVAVMEAARG
jgi:glutamate synthase (NADPH/NADH) large chain